MQTHHSELYGASAILKELANNKYIVGREIRKGDSEVNCYFETRPKILSRVYYNANKKQSKAFMRDSHKSKNHQDFVTQDTTR